MHSVGIGGVDEIDADLFPLQVVKKPLIYMTPGWKSAFRYAAHLAGRYGMEFSIDSSPGWSETGGPWVKPAEAMKKLVWSATVVTGGKPYDGVLPQPPDTTGPMQNAPLRSGMMGPQKYAALKFYRDSVVIAYQAPVLDPRPSAGSSSTGPLSAQALEQLSDGSLTGGIALAANGGKASLVLRYRRAVRVQGVTLAASASRFNGVAATVSTSLDGSTWKSVGSLALASSPLSATLPEETISFAPVMCRYVRVALTVTSPRMPSGPTAHHAPGAVPLSALFAGLQARGKASPKFYVHEFVAHRRATVNEFEAKADFGIVPDYYAIASTAPSSVSRIGG